MIRKVVQKEDGDFRLEVDNTELLHERADVSIQTLAPREHYQAGSEEKYDTFTDERGGLGTMKTEADQKVRKDEHWLGWHEPTVKSLAVKHKCPICGTVFMGRPNKKYCSDRCKATANKRTYRKSIRDKRDFKPYTGTAGEVYFMTTVDNRDIIAFIPASYTATRAKAKEYLEQNYPKGMIEEYFEQVKEVIKK